MKLYSTIKNEKQKISSLGGNESISIEINKGNRRMIEFYTTIETIGNIDYFVVDMLNLSDGRIKRVFEYEFYTKGKR